MPDLLKRLDARAERGFSMFLVIMAMFVTMMFVAAAFAAANGDLPVAGVATERKSDYAAAEAGLGYYLNRLQQDPDYWTKCDTAPPNATEKNPVNQVNSNPLNLRWRQVTPGSKTDLDQYAIELLPVSPATTCDTKNQATFVDQATGTFKIRVSGRTSDKATRIRQIIATFRRDSFLNFVYFTNYENRDPAAESSATERQRQSTACANKYRSERADDNCTEIQFATGDEINGPLHTNDESVLVCGSPVFGRTTNMDGSSRDKTDATEVRGNAPGWVSKCTGSNPTINNVANDNKIVSKARMLALPESNKMLIDVAKLSASLYTGLTYIRLTGTTMTITNNGSTTTKNFPTNGVLYVQNDVTCEGETPTAADYANEPASCGNVYVSGTYGKSLTIAAENDVIITPTQGASSPDITEVAGTDATLGLIANNFVRVAHRVGSNCGANQSPVYNNVTIHAAILALQHSFIVDNYQCGARMADLTVRGAIVQKYRGPVGTSSPTGYIKNYWYDDRFRYRSPPYFLTPVAASWDVVRQHEVVKGS
ncbi:hypothetical protein OJ997_14075 [Solirubrobacter phytolaccae]|uniref:Uncharacterized protein n=1 Tax=Solirubrobacter phytolaccae TaxID=1404360 RepID=A0A9X3SFE4_9ACTN|nr:hypothetical protein [Solirubrobacter phytolaccae]MDA0181427.1 hypothetical protein [Solirubrobacter phytolaccae]